MDIPRGGFLANPSLTDFFLERVDILSDKCLFVDVDSLDDFQPLSEHISFHTFLHFMLENRFQYLTSIIIAPAFVLYVLAFDRHSIQGTNMHFVVIRAPIKSPDDGLVNLRGSLFLDDLNDFRDGTSVISNIDLHVMFTDDSGASLGESQHLL